MSTLIAISGLGIICMLLEILNLRKIVVPVSIILLLGILGMTYCEFHRGISFIHSDSYNMVSSGSYSHAFSMLFIILAILLIAMTGRFYRHRRHLVTDYVTLKIFLLAGAVAMVSFGNMLMFFIGLEVLSIIAYVLAASNPKRIKSNEAALKYFLMGALASGFVLFGIALVYGAVGSFDVSVIKTFFMKSNQIMPVFYQIGFLMILVGLLFKASVVPFHFWAPDVYEGSPTLVTALMSSLVKVAAIGALFKMVSIFDIGFTPAYRIVIVVLSILSMIVGNITAMRQTNMKRMMAYSGISHAGFMVMTLLVTHTGSTTVVYYAVAYSLAVVAAFAVILAVGENKGQQGEDIKSFHGLIRTHPTLAIILTGSLLSLSGIPLFGGFFAKMFVFNQMLHSGYWILVVFGILNSILAVGYYFRVINVMYTKKPDASEKTIRLNRLYSVVGLIAVIIIVIIGVFPALIMG